MKKKIFAVVDTNVIVSGMVVTPAEMMEIIQRNLEE